MAVHSRSENGVASLAYVTAIHAFLSWNQGVDARDKPAHDAVQCLPPSRYAACTSWRLSSSAPVPVSVIVPLTIT